MILFNYLYNELLLKANSVDQSCPVYEPFVRIPNDNSNDNARQIDYGRLWPFEN